MARLEKLFDAKKGTAKGDELEVLSILIEQYEDENFPIDLPDPVEAIKFRN
jgi:HTH-type transcriptional regulator/antitoxin HigA